MSNDQDRNPQQPSNPQQQNPAQQNEQGEGSERKSGEGERIDTDGDGRTRDPNDTRPTDDGGRDAPVDR